jgi:hypothetical protein
MILDRVVHSVEISVFREINFSSFIFSLVWVQLRRIYLGLKGFVIVVCVGTVALPVQ